MGSCRQQVPAFVDIACEWESGRINAIAFVDEDKAEIADEDTSQWSTPSFWTSEDYAASILIHQQVSGGYAGADTDIPGKGNQQTRTGGKNHTATVRIESVKGNDDYFNKLNLSTNYRVVLVTDDYNMLLVSTNNVGIKANIILEDSLESICEWEVVITWSDIKLPETYDVPAGIFN